MRRWPVGPFSGGELDAVAQASVLRYPPARDALLSGDQAQPLGPTRLSGRPTGARVLLPEISGGRVTDQVLTNGPRRSSDWSSPSGELQPNVVLMDIRMPELDGIEATRQIIQAGDTRVVVLTTFDLDEYVYDD